jgi:transcriptional regulator with XRE-family HTH domain
MEGTASPLGEFLRARRHRLVPEEVGVPEIGRRRVVGLRREELAMRAGVSSHYYARLERGNDRHPSAQVVDALADALQLDDQGRAHLRRLAEPPTAVRRSASAKQEPASPVELLISRRPEEPIVLVGRYREVLLANPIAVALNPGFAPGTNLLRHTFLDPASRDIYPDWEEVAEGAVAGLRSEVGGNLDDPDLAHLIRELSRQSPEFTAMWARHDVRARDSGFKRYNTAAAGLISLRFASFQVTGVDHQLLYVFFPEAGSEAENSLKLLSRIG